MISIIQHIQYLILNRDCVVLPGLGAFVCRNIPASVSPDFTSITPPAREVSFNSSLTHDDGTLTASITRREGVSYECARGAVEQEVELIHRRLRNEGMLELDRIGRLSLTPHGTIEFTPATNRAVSALPFTGLDTLTLMPLQITTDIINESLPDIESESGHTTPGKRRWIMPALKYAASAAIMFGVCLTLLTPTSPSDIDLASLQPRISTEVGQQEQAECFPVPDESKYAGYKIILYQPDPNEATAFAGPAKKNVSDADSALKNNCVTSAADKSGTSMIQGKTPDRYYVIVASTSSLKEARKYIKWHSTASQPLRIIASEGRYRVYAASGNDFDAMSAYRTADRNFAKKNPDAWVYTLK